MVQWGLLGQLRMSSACIFESFRRKIIKKFKTKDNYSRSKCNIDAAAGNGSIIGAKIAQVFIWATTSPKGSPPSIRLVLVGRSALCLWVLTVGLNARPPALQTRHLLVASANFVL
jgi:hypothetical protein